MRWRNIQRNITDSHCTSLPYTFYPKTSASAEVSTHILLFPCLHDHQYMHSHRPHIFIVHLLGSFVEKWISRDSGKFVRAPEYFYFSPNRGFISSVAFHSAQVRTRSSTVPVTNRVHYEVTARRSSHPFNSLSAQRKT